MASERINLERALLAAIDDNDLPAADGLIRSGADVNRRGPLPLTALMLAAGRGSTQMVGKLLAAGADVHVVDSTMGASALHFAAQGGVIDIAQLLLDAGAFINLQSATVGLTPLITAIWAKQVPIVAICWRAVRRSTSRPTSAAPAPGTSWGRAYSGRLVSPNPKPVRGRQIRELLEQQRAEDGAVLARQTLDAGGPIRADLAKVQRLIAEGVDVNAKSPVLANGNDGQTPCWWPALGHAAIARPWSGPGVDRASMTICSGQRPYTRRRTPVDQTRCWPSASTVEWRSTPRDHSMATPHCTMPSGTGTATPWRSSSTGRGSASTCAAWTDAPEELGRSLGYDELADMIKGEAKHRRTGAWPRRRWRTRRAERQTCRLNASRRIRTRLPPTGFNFPRLHLQCHARR